jgi:hypothetical protein
MLPFYSLDQLEAAEVTKMYEIKCNTITAGSHDRRDLPLFHEHQGGGEVSAMDGAKAKVHNLVGNAVENPKAIAREHASGIGVRDQAD